MAVVGMYGFSFTIPIGIIIFIFGTINKIVSRRSLIIWMTALFLLPGVLILLSGLVWLAR